MTTETDKSITSGQIDTIANLTCQAVKTVIKKVNPTGKDAQTGIITNGGEYKRRITEAIEPVIRDMVTLNRYANEVVSSNYTYPKEYPGPKPIIDQVKTIAELFGLDPTQALEFAKSLPKLTDKDQGWFAIAKVSAVAQKHFPEITDIAEQYCGAVKLVHTKLNDSRIFHNYYNGEITPAKLRQHPRTLDFLEILEEQQKGDILIIAVQYGIRHRGKSVRRARETFARNEFGLTSFQLGCMALTHPERYVKWEQLHTDCAGDQLAPAADGHFSKCPVFRFRGGLRFSSGDVSDANAHYGSCSGFLTTQ